jgi:HrpA-like RNA helicase
VFEKMPAGVRKVVLSTNIAETSVTIDDVVFVIDCGRHKENRFDPVNRMPQLMEAWVARANSRQRRGRAGRVRPGHAFFLFTRERSKNMAECVQFSSASLAPPRRRFVEIIEGGGRGPAVGRYQTPEMHRVPLDELCLQIKLLDLGDVAEFLGKAIEPPKEEAVAEAIKGASRCAGAAPYASYDGVVP